ncbi:MAG: NERD domain-containing protein, partial [Oscillospiraceae bacterium]|nr:NERD domain-containing protein [Oscillospiraceae bacterium]
MEIEQVYKQLTNVDIEEQKRIWDERGKGYYGEYLLFCELYKNVAGHGKILMNLNIPTESGGTTEIDLILIHETGIYVFEIKHYKGTIYGKDTDS